MENSEHDMSTEINFHWLHVIHHKTLQAVAPIDCNVPDVEQHEAQAGKWPIVAHISQVRLLRWLQNYM